MAGYVVRLRENGELAGIFWVTSPFELHEQVSEVAEPTECEYSTLPPGGIIWPCKTVRVPMLGEYDRDLQQYVFLDDPVQSGSCEPSESLWQYLRDAESLWLPLPPVVRIDFELL
jgi:hypothetical protein